LRIVDNISNELFLGLLWSYLNIVIFKHKPVYLDYQATTPLDQRVLAVMLPYFDEHFGNAASRNHLYGWSAAAAIDLARSQIATAIGAEPLDIIFTSGATEANNLAIKGIAEAHLSKGRHIVTAQTEHRSILEPCRYLEQLGFDITYLPVDENGLLSIGQLEAAIRPDTILVSVMVANNEIGVIQPIAKMAQICRQRQIIFHTDAAQGIGKIPFNVQSCPVDLLSITGHKVYGPKGIGALYMRPNVRLAPQIIGGGQEHGLRAGTLPTPQIVGLGQAIELAVSEQVLESQRLMALRDDLWRQLQQIPDIHLNGSIGQRLPDNLNVSFARIFPNELLRELQGVVALAAGSACSSGQASHVLKAIGRSPNLASLRFSLGKFTTATDIDRVAGAVQQAVQKLRG
jgi:cysteine desulfurase